VWRQSYDVAKPAETYPKNGYASATPATDGVRVYVFFDDPGLVALSAATGEKLWTRPLGPFANGWNLAASPALCGPAVIVACDHDKESFLLAADAATGREMWRTPRKLGRQYATPIVFRHGARQQVVVNGQQVISYAPADGRELWRCGGMMQVCVPSAVYAGGLVWVGSGRNGPAMAIDPSGSGDVTETHVRMQVPVGGPYVPSPLVLPGGLMMLPGDNGKVRLIAADGHVAAECRLEGHFSASPAFGDGRVYWSNEAGDTYVLGVTGRPGGASDGATRLDVLAVNSLGERILASPALVEGRVYLRTAGQLYCLAGRARPASAAAQDKLPTDFASLKKLYEAHQGDQKGQVEHPDVAVRLAVVREMGIHKDPAAVEFLKSVAEKDQHWDVSEEAVKVLCTYERAALKEMIELLESTNWRGYLKVSPAETVGRLQAAEAAPALLKLARDGDRLNRIAALSALARIASGHQEIVADSSSALLAGLKDKEGVVQKAALEGLALLAEKLGPARPAALAAVKALADSPNPIVAQSARAAAAKLAAPPKAR
jgi:outer membrane protein assembly factor BamB